MTPRFLGLLALLTLASAGRLPAQAVRAQHYELRGGTWFDGGRFVQRSMYVVDGMFQRRRPARVDSVIDLGTAYVIPPFGDAHTHAFDNPATIASAVETHLREGVFYALSLTNSIAGKRAVASSVNRPTSVDVAYADAGLTSTYGHPIMSAEMAANHWRWDSLGVYWSQLLTSRKAEGDVYFLIDSLPDVRRQWSRIVASRPDIIKIFLLDTEQHPARRGDPRAFGSVGLDPGVVSTIVVEAHRSGLRVCRPYRNRGGFSRGGVERG